LVIYQFIIATQHINGGNLIGLADSDGNLTSHLMGILQRNVFFMNNGIKPIWVFDGLAPIEKKDTLIKRSDLKSESIKKKNSSLDVGDIKSAQKYSKRGVYVTKQMKLDSIKLVKLLGLPCIEAPEEGEAQCSYLASTNKVFGVATEDMDCLAFGSPYLLRNFNIKNKITEIRLETILDKLEISLEEYIDICILCGCDFCDKISSIGPFTAYTLIKNYNNIEGVLEHIETSKKNKYKYHPEKFDYLKARKIFLEPSVSEEKFFKLSKTDYKSVINFLSNEKNFSIGRVNSILEKINSKI
jgi:flap endonuclease-1